MKEKTLTFLTASLLLTTCVVNADVFNMPVDQKSLELLHIGNLGNIADNMGFGAVAHEYDIGKYEVTSAQYTQFLNAVASMGDPYGLYNPTMVTMAGGCKIQQVSLPEGGYSYRVQPEYANKPANCLTWDSAARFCNWLHNGQPAGPVGPGTTENGAYNVYNINWEDIWSLTRGVNAKYAIATIDEWVKTAYHKNDGLTGNYWNYPTSSRVIPTAEAPPGGTNSANYVWTTLKTTTSVGSYINTTSPYGAYDMGGNVWEWTETPFPATGKKGIRGGCFGNGSTELWRLSNFSEYIQNSSDAIGFRIVKLAGIEDGDANNDGLVNIGDLGVLAGNWGGGPGMTWFQGDFTYDGMVNVSDLGILAGKWGWSKGAGGLAIPEPATIGLLALGGLALFRRSRKE